MRQAAAERAFLLPRVLFGEPDGHGEPKHAITKEFQPLVRALAGSGGRAVGQCFLQQPWIAEAIAEQPFDSRPGLFRKSIRRNGGFTLRRTDVCQ